MTTIHEINSRVNEAKLSNDGYNRIALMEKKAKAGGERQDSVKF